MGSCLARLVFFSLLALSWVSCGCEGTILKRSAILSGSDSSDEWRTCACIGSKGQGVHLIAVSPERPGETTISDQFIATANTWLLRTDERAGCMGGCPVGYVKMWGQPLEGLELLSTMVMNEANDLRFTPDGHGVAYACKDGIIIWHNDDRRFETRLAGSNSRRFEFSADCRWIVQIDIEDESTKITVLDFETLKPRGPAIIVKKTSTRTDCHVSSDGIRLSTVVYESEPKRATAVVFNIETGVQERALSIDHDSWRVAWSASGKFLAAENSTDEVLPFWDMTAGELRCTAGRQSKIRCLAITPNERLVVSGGEGADNGKPAAEVVVRDAITGRELSRFLNSNSWGVTALAIAQNGMLMIGTGDGYVIIRKIPDRILAQAEP